MIVAPYILSQIQRQSFPADSTLGCQLSFQISPKAFQAINMVAFFIYILFLAMVNQAMNIAFGRNTSVRFPGIRKDGRSWLHPSRNQRHQSIGFHVRNHLSPDPPAPAQDPKYWGLGSTSASLGWLPFISFPLVLPLAAYVGLVYLYLAAKHLWNILQHFSSNLQQRAHNSFPINATFLSDFLARKFLQKRPQNFSPFRCLEMKRKSAGRPFMAAPNASDLSSSDNVGFSIRAFRTFMPFRHATMLSFLVAKLGLYPYFINI